MWHSTRDTLAGGFSGIWCQLTPSLLGRVDGFGGGEGGDLFNKGSPLLYPDLSPK